MRSEKYRDTFDWEGACSILSIDIKLGINPLYIRSGFTEKAWLCSGHQLITLK